MKPRLLSLIVLLSVGQEVYAVQPYVSLGLGPVTGNDNIHSSTMYNGELGFMTQGLSTSFEFSYINQTSKQGSMEVGEITLMPYFLDFGGVVPMSKRFNLNLGAGVGYVNTDKTINEETDRKNRLLGYDIREDIESDIAWKVRGGMDYKLTQNVWLTLTIGHVFFDTKVHEVRKNLNLLTTYKRETIIDLNYTYGNFGVKYLF